jgi:hypothetical protein
MLRPRCLTVVDAPAKAPDTPDTNNAATRGSAKGNHLPQVKIEVEISEFEWNLVKFSEFLYCLLKCSEL